MYVNLQPQEHRDMTSNFHQNKQQNDHIKNDTEEGAADLSGNIFKFRVNY